MFLMKELLWKHKNQHKQHKQSQSLTTLTQKTNEEHQMQTRRKTQPLLPTTTDGTKRNQKQSEQPKKRQRKRSTAMKPRKSTTGRTGSERSRCICCTTMKGVEPPRHRARCTLCREAVCGSHSVVLDFQCYNHMLFYLKRRKKRSKTK